MYVWAAISSSYLSFRLLAVPDTEPRDEDHRDEAVKEGLGLRVVDWDWDGRCEAEWLMRAWMVRGLSCEEEWLFGLMDWCV